MATVTFHVGADKRPDERGRAAALDVAALGAGSWCRRSELAGSVGEQIKAGDAELEKWIAKHGGRHFGPGAGTLGGRYYLLPAGRVPFD